MSRELNDKVSAYKELLDLGFISEEKYYEIIEHLINEKVSGNNELSFNKKRDNLISQTSRKTEELRNKIAGYEERNRKEYEQKLRDDMTNEEISFAVSFLSQIYNSYGKRIYSDEILNDEEAMPLYRMQSLISKYKENEPEMYNEIIEKIGYKEEVVNNPVEQPIEKSEEKVSDFDSLLVEQRAEAENKTSVEQSVEKSEEKVSDFDSLLVEERTEAENKTSAEQPVENKEEVKKDEDKKGEELVEEMTTNPRKSILVSIKQASSSLIDKIKDADGKIKSDIKVAALVAAMVVGTLIAGPAAPAVVGVATGTGMSLSSKIR